MLCSPLTLVVHAASAHVLSCPGSEGTGVLWADADAVCPELAGASCLSLTHEDTLTAQILEKPLADTFLGASPLLDSVTVTGRAHPSQAASPPPPHSCRVLASGSGALLGWWGQEAGQCRQRRAGLAQARFLPGQLLSPPGASVSSSENESHSLGLQGGRCGECLAQNRGQCSFFLLFCVMKNCLVKGLSWRSSWLGCHLLVWGVCVCVCVCMRV